MDCPQSVESLALDYLIENEMVDTSLAALLN